MKLTLLHPSMLDSVLKDLKAAWKKAGSKVNSKGLDDWWAKDLKFWRNRFNDDKMHFTVTCEGTKEEAVGKAVAKFNSDMDELKKQMKQMQAMMPQSMTDMINSIKVKQDGIFAYCDENRCAPDD